MVSEVSSCYNHSSYHSAGTGDLMWLAFLPCKALHACEIRILRARVYTNFVLQAGTQDRKVGVSKAQENGGGLIETQPVRGMLLLVKEVIPRMRARFAAWCSLCHGIHQFDQFQSPFL